MAKKRVHEIAKERGISSKEVIAILQRAGLDVKAAASSVDERDINMAFSNGGSRGGGGRQEAEQHPQQQQAAAQRPAGPRPDGPPPQGGGPGGPPQGGRPARPPDRGQRPTRGVPPRDGQGGGRRRRVVIDSQASRRPQGPPPPQQPPRRGRGRRRRTPWVEPDLTPQQPVVEEVQVVTVQSGATVKEVAES